MKQKKSASILRKFLLFNLTVFSILGLFTIIYLKAIQPNLIKKRTLDHYIIINNTIDHIKRLNINFNANDIKTFLLSTRFLFQSLDRVQFYNNEGDLIGDTNILDLDQNVFTKSDIIIEETIDGKIKEKNNIKQLIDDSNKDSVKKVIINEYKNEPLTISETIQNNFFVSTLSQIRIDEKDIGYIVVSEEANDILNAVKERKDFIIRTVLAVALVILIFSLFLNKYILKPIGLLVAFSDAIRKKSNKNIDIKNFFVREDEIGKLSTSIDEMTKELQKRTNRAETFSNDLAHEIRNPLASLKSASELLDKTTEKMESEKLLKIINHDVERIERLITDYSQMLKDEASLSREKMSKINLLDIINNVTEDFRQDLKNQNKKIFISINQKINTESGYYILGIENRLEQVIANLLDNSISFSENNNKIEIEVEETSRNLVMSIKDEGPGFSETTPEKIFKRFYSNRPKSFGKHSGLGLNIVKNIVELHKGTIAASNRLNKKGAQVEVLLPKFSQ
jgi:two-component system, OmpR family, sensor histidine kinase ChvG